MRNRFLLLVVFLLTFPCYLLAQDTVADTSYTFEDGLELYQQENYHDAAGIFATLEGDRAQLYAGKSFLALGNYLKAGIYLSEALKSDVESISNEALYTLAINHFRLKNYTRSLELLYEMQNIRDRTGLRVRAQRMYNEILRYLTEDQRHEVFMETGEDQIRIDLVRSSINRVDYPVIASMAGQLRNLAEARNDTLLMQNIWDEIGEQSTYAVSPFMQLNPPQGMVYHIGVALPAFEPDQEEFSIPRNLYDGLTLAAEEFNARNPDKKVFLRYRNTHSEPDSIHGIFSDLIWQEKVDAIVGPLFSETAKAMSELSENYRLPMMAPLANSDSIHLGSQYTFQLNPTFAVHGKNMARFAVQELGLDTLAVISETDALGHSSALAFRYEAERLGAHISYYFEEDLRAEGYDLSEYTKFFTPDSVLIDSLNYTPTQGLYAPFTGQAAGSLTNLLMNDLEALGTDMVVMGSEEWKNARLTTRQQRNFPIYYTEAVGSVADTTDLNYFTEDYKNRFGSEPDHFSKIGYDTGSFLLNVLERSGNPALLRQTLRNAPHYNGLSMQIHFNGTQINQLVSVHPLTEKARERLREEEEDLLDQF